MSIFTIYSNQRSVQDKPTCWCNSSLYAKHTIEAPFELDLQGPAVSLCTVLQAQAS